MTTSESLSRSNPINQPPDHGQPQPPRPPGVQSTDSPAPQQTGTVAQTNNFDAIRQGMAKIRQDAMQVDNSHELAAFLEKLASAEAAMMELEVADRQRQQDKKDKENMQIGEEEEQDQSHDVDKESHPFQATGETGTGAVEREVRNVRRSEQRTEPDKDKE